MKKHLYKSELGLFTSKFTISLIIIIALASSGINLNAQTVTQPKADVTTTAKHYNYTYKISESTYKVIEYVLVLASNGDIKSTFNACDVCYPAHKGYSQSGTKLRCNNCGNTFDISALGSQGSGGCWPGHLPHTLDGDNVVFTVSDLAKGEYFFPLQTLDVTDETPNPISLNISNDGNLNVNFGGKIASNLKIVSAIGNLEKQIPGSFNEYTVVLQELISGIYFVVTDIDGKTFTKKFIITR